MRVLPLLGCLALIGCTATTITPPTVPDLAGVGADPDAFIQLVSGREHSCGLRSDGRVWCWGDNRFGELGIELESPHEMSVAKREVAGLSSIVQLAAGARHTCALQHGGAVWCWGAPWHGRLGGQSVDAPRPVRVLDIDDALTITAGDDHSCALRETPREIVCWGSGRSGQLGEDHVDSGSSVPVAVASGRGVAQLVSTSTTTCARTSGGRVWCWGGWDGAPMPALRRPLGARGVTELTADSHSVCALGPELGTVCWDANDLEHPLTDPELLARVDGPAQLGALAQHCVIDDRRAQCWRARVWADTPPLRSLALPKDSHVLSLTHGQRHACASLTTGETLCWGDNARGQLGGAWVTGATANPWADTEPELVDDRFVCEVGLTRAGEAGVEQWCLDASGRRHGPSIRYHPNGQLAESGRHERGQREGTWRTWHDRGAPAMTGPYVADLRHGGWTVHAGEDGWTGVFEHGAPNDSWVFRTREGAVLREIGFEHGKQRLWAVHDATGSPRARLEQTPAGYVATTWTDAGERTESSVLVDARPSWSIEAATWQAELPAHFVMHGDLRRHAASGALIEAGRHERSQRVGTWQRWYESGERREQTDYAANQRHGRSRAWYADGQLQHDGHFAHGTRDGEWARWYEDGQRREQGSFARGVRAGVHRSWYANAQLQSRRDVDSGAFTTWYESGRRRAKGRISVMSDIGDLTSMLGAPMCAELISDVGSIEPQGAALTVPPCLGQPHARWWLWWPDGTLAADGTFHLGHPTGKWRYWDEDGARLRQPCTSEALVEMFAAEGAGLGCAR